MLGGEQRTQDIHGLDQVVEQRGEGREQYRQHAPGGGEDLGGANVVGIRRFFAQAALVDVHHRGRGQRGQLAGNRRHGGAEDNREAARSGRSAHEAIEKMRMGLRQGRRQVGSSLGPTEFSCRRLCSSVDRTLLRTESV